VHVEGRNEVRGLHVHRLARAKYYGLAHGGGGGQATRGSKDL